VLRIGDRNDHVVVVVLTLGSPSFKEDREVGEDRLRCL